MGKNFPPSVCFCDDFPFTAAIKVTCGDVNKTRSSQPCGSASDAVGFCTRPDAHAGRSAISYIHWKKCNLLRYLDLEGHIYKTLPILLDQDHGSSAHMCVGSYSVHEFEARSAESGCKMKFTSKILIFFRVPF